MHIAVIEIELHIPWASSLKDKRRVTRGFKQFVKNMNVSIGESSHLDKWQRAGFTMAMVCLDRETANKTINLIDEKIDQTGEATLAHVNIEFL